MYVKIIQMDIIDLKKGKGGRRGEEGEEERRGRANSSEFKSSTEPS